MHARRLIPIMMLLGALVVGIIVLQRKAAPPAHDDRLSVVATFYPLAEFAQRVGGDRIRVTNLTPAGVEPHDFEPTPQAIGQISTANILLVNGGGIDAWATTLAPSLRDHGVRVVTMAPLMATLLPPPTKEEGGAFDEHFWLNPLLAAREVDAIRDALIAEDPVYADEYRARADAFMNDLAALDRDLATGTQSCAIRAVVTAHAPFGYLARQYHFEQIPISGLSTDEEPSAGTLAAIAREATARGITYIFTETLVSPKLSETLARTIGARTLVFNPLEGLTDADLASGATYLSAMRENLTHLRTAMTCR